MIGRIKGYVEIIGPDHVIVDVHGIGYIVHVSRSVLGSCVRLSEIIFYVETVIRQDGIQLFGFTDTVSHAWFKILTAIQGVGPKMALAILGYLSGSDILGAIQRQDRGLLTRVPGVGPKVADRILLELKDAKKISMIPKTEGDGKGTYVSDAIEALTVLGFERERAFQTVHHLFKQNSSLSREDLIRQGLNFLG